MCIRDRSMRVNKFIIFSFHRNLRILSLGSNLVQNKRKMILVVGLFSVIFLLFLYGEVGNFVIITEKTRYGVNETITATLLQKNKLPIPVLASTYNKITASVYLNDKQVDAGYVVHLSHVSVIMVIPRGGQTWVSPVRFTPTETGEVEFVFELYLSLIHI